MCNCSGNWEELTEGNCDPRTGQCLKCLWPTEVGAHCFFLNWHECSSQAASADLVKPTKPRKARHKLYGHGRKICHQNFLPISQPTTIHYYTLYTTIHCLCFVKGFNCEHCMAGYFGDATLGGMCSECTCYTLGTDPERSIENKCSYKSMKVWLAGILKTMTDKRTNCPATNQWTWGVQWYMVTTTFGLC